LLGYSRRYHQFMSATRCCLVGALVAVAATATSLSGALLAAAAPPSCQEVGTMPICGHGGVSGVLGHYGVTPAFGVSCISPYGSYQNCLVQQEGLSAIRSASVEATHGRALISTPHFARIANGPLGR
jgi:hypothetical protein